jgi:hypothetical protein
VSSIAFRSVEAAAAEAGCKRATVCPNAALRAARQAASKAGSCDVVLWPDNDQTAKLRVRPK